MSVSVWEAIFMLVVLKIPLVYISAVVWWAVRAEPDAAGGGATDEVGAITPLEPCGWADWKRRRLRPNGRRPNRPIAPRMRARATIA